MIPVTVMATGKATVSRRIKGSYGVGRPSRFTSVFKPVVFWNITYQCNLRCKHCYISALPNPQRLEIPVEKVLEIADQILELNLPLVVFSGGEPLLSKKFWAAAERLAGHDKPKLALSTNGTLISREVAAKLKKLGFMYVGVSIDSADPVKHDSFRGVKGAFEAAIRGIRNAVEAGIDVGIRTTITRENIGEVEKILELAERLGARRVSLYILDTVGRGKEIVDLMPTPSQLKEFADRIVDLARKYSDTLEILIVRANFIGIYIASKLAKSREEFEKYLELIDSQGDCGRKTVSIYPDGTVRPCQFLENVVIGDLRRQRLEEILSPKNPLLKPFLEIHERLRGPKCSKCPFKRICGGGSRNRAYVVNNDFWGDDPLCFIDYNDVLRQFT